MNRRTFLGFAFGPPIVGVLSAISLPVMTWIFPAEVIGQVSMLQVALGLAIVLFSLGLDQAYGREYHETSDHAALLFNTTMPGLFLLVLALILILSVDATSVSRWLYGIESRALSAVTALCLVVAYISRFLALVLRMQDRSFAYSLSQVMPKLLLLLIIIVYALMPTGKTLMMLLLGQLLALVISLLVLGWDTRKDWAPALRSNLVIAQFKPLLAFGFPLTFAGVASWGMGTVDRVFLRSLSTYDELAVYSVATSIAAAVNVLAGILNTVWTPIIFKWHAEKRDMSELDAIAEFATVIMFLIVCLAGGTSWVLQYVLPPEYALVPYLVIPCMLAPLFYALSEITGVGIAVSRKTWFSLVAALGAVLVGFAACRALIPSLGAFGAAIASACSFWLFLALRTEFSALAWRQLKRRKVYFYTTLCIALSLAYSYFGPQNPLRGAVMWWLILMVFGYAERSIMMKFVEFIAVFMGVKTKFRSGGKS